MDATRGALSEQDFTAAWEEGKAMDLKQAVDYARQVVKEIQGYDAVIKNQLNSGDVINSSL